MKNIKTTLDEVDAINWVYLFALQHASKAKEEEQKLILKYVGIAIDWVARAYKRFGKEPMELPPGIPVD